ncbi:MAG: hypothetical protein AW08_02613 [Candidatus Accumulibacter adjunctus]|uniref:Uncharacterized protein n=1 Tax=Candidatus Accumulibacter adjunctus TaxID=1454001 RepID=A0A011PJS9_9PROT|nr:MAG: hypothetical protein AW08_02613 [Candidatus Accumulibacter adjunctus]
MQGSGKGPLRGERSLARAMAATPERHFSATMRRGGICLSHALLGQAVGRGAA